MPPPENIMFKGYLKIENEDKKTVYFQNEPPEELKSSDVLYLSMDQNLTHYLMVPLARIVYLDYFELTIQQAK